MQRKQTILTELDAKIATSITENEELEKDSEEYCSLIATNIARIAHLIEVSKATRPPQPVHAPLSTESCEHVATLTTSKVSPEHTVATATYKPQDITRLPKLSIPLFSGDILHWRSFCDCFETAVHNNPAYNNPALSGVQKLNYLCAQL